MLLTVMPAENSSSAIPTTAPVRLIANGRDRAPGRAGEREENHQQGGRNGNQRSVNNLSCRKGALNHHAPAPSVAEHRLLIEPGEWRRAAAQHRFLADTIITVVTSTLIASSRSPDPDPNPTVGSFYSLLIPTSEGRVPMPSLLYSHTSSPVVAMHGRPAQALGDQLPDPNAFDRPANELYYSRDVVGRLVIIRACSSAVIW